jgi:vacuolar-type H+-ATPase subunit B/Vma2
MKGTIARRQMYTHQNCNNIYAEQARLASGAELVAAGIGTYQFRGDEKQFRLYCQSYKGAAARHGKQVMTGEFIVDGYRLCTML